MSAVTALTTLLALPLIGFCLLTAALYSILRPRKPRSSLSHEDKCRDLQAQFKLLVASGNKAPVCTSRNQNECMTTRNTISSYKQTATLIDMEYFNEVVEVNVKEGYVEAESRVTIGELIDRMIPMGFTIAVVPELRTLTIGGLICGAGIESSSHRHGLFMNTCLAYKVMFGDGSIQTVTADNNAQLFSWIPFSSGSLCMFISARIRLIPACSHVMLTYSLVHSREEAIEELTQTCQASEGDKKYADFVEGILFTRDDGIIVRANMYRPNGDHGKVPVNKIRWYSGFWYQHVKTTYWSPSQNKNNQNQESMSLSDYYFRHDRGIFWTLERKFPCVLNSVFRLLFGWVLDSRLRRLSILSDRGSVSEVKREVKRVVQDPIVPLKYGVDALKQFDSIFGITPVWLCPFKVIPLPTTSLLQFPQNDSSYDFYLDIGLYAVPTTKDYDPVRSHRLMEKFLRDHAGFVAPYAVCYSTKPEFWKMYHKKNYDDARLVTDADGKFVDIYDKIGGGKKVEEYENNIE
jgi:hypothetical protein